MKIRLAEIGVYLKQLVKNPLRLGSVIPSSKETAQFIVKHIKKEAGFIIELGAGTGSFTKALLESGVSKDNLICVEIEPSFCDFLRKRFPGLRVVCGNAAKLADILPKDALGNIVTVVSSIPFLSIPKQLREDIVVSTLEVMNPDGRFIQVSYSPVSPVPWQKLGLIQHRYGFIWRNFPPINIFGYEKNLDETGTKF